jgi:hypothetical protein
MRMLLKTLALAVGLTFLAPAAMADDPPDTPKKVVKKTPKKVVKKAPKKVVKKAPKKAPKKVKEEN